MDENKVEGTSSKSKYVLPKPGEGKYFFGTDVEKIYNSLGDANIFSVNAKDLAKEMELIGDDIKYMQDNISWWIGDASSTEGQSMKTIMNGLETSLNNVKSSIEPACEKIALFKAKIELLKETEERYKQTESNYQAIKNRISNLSYGSQSGLNTTVTNGNNNFDKESDLNSLNTLLAKTEQELSSIQQELDSLLAECNSLYEEIKAFENELETFDFIIGPDYKGILKDEDRLNSLPLLTQYMMKVGAYGSYQGAVSVLFDYIPKMLGDDYYNLLDENGFLPEEYGILAKKYNDVVKIMHENDIYDIDEMRLCAEQLAEVGCGYAATVNIVTDMYKDKPILFESSFGYPLYYTDEENRAIYNYEAMLTDAYLTYLGKDVALNGSIAERPVPVEELFEEVITFVGMNDELFKYNFFEHEDDYDSIIVQPDVDTSMSIDVSDGGFRFYQQIENSDYFEKNDALLTNEGAVQAYKEYMNEYDYAVISLYNFDLTPIGNNNSDEVIHIENGGHYMQITGISENGNFIVSSWGREYELTNYSFVDEVDVPEELVPGGKYTRSGKISFMKVGGKDEK